MKITIYRPNGEITVSTDAKWKHLKFRHEVPSHVLTNQFSHLTDETGGGDGFFRYRKRWYHLSDFLAMRIDSPLCPEWPKGDKRPYWNGYLSDSFFSGVLIELSSDGECYRVGTFTS